MYALVRISQVPDNPLLTKKELIQVIVCTEEQSRVILDFYCSITQGKATIQLDEIVEYSPPEAQELPN